MLTAMSTARRILGVVLIILGVLALVTPLTPGSWLIFVGAEILGLELVFARKIAAYLRGQAGKIIPVLCLVAPFVAGGLGSIFSVSAVAGWYMTIAKPWWTPPGYVFGPVWTTLYLLMGIAALLVWRANRPGREFALGLFFAHLAANALWSVVFFGLQAPGMAFAVIVVLWLMIVWLIVQFAQQAKTAAWLLAPYLLWVTYAATLNLGVYLLN